MNRFLTDIDDAAILDKLAELDPMDQVGGSVIRALAARMEEQDEYAA